MLGKAQTKNWLIRKWYLRVRGSDLVIAGIVRELMAGVGHKRQKL
jgi:hypothetical protein